MEKIWMQKKKNMHLRVKMFEQYYLFLHHVYEDRRRKKKMIVVMIKNFKIETVV